MVSRTSYLKNDICEYNIYTTKFQIAFLLTVDMYISLPVERM